MPAQDQQERRTDLDWVRVGAFAILIFFHVGMYYAPADWEIKSPHILDWLAIPMDLTSPWRLLVLFIVSGAATRFMFGKSSPGALLVARSKRLLLPLLFGVLIIIPPQSYVQAVERFGYVGDFFGFWLRYLLADHSICRGGDCLFLPDWKHLWFVGYLWIYTALLLGLATIVPAFESLLERWASRLVGWRLLVVPGAFLVITQLSLSHFFPEPAGLTDDWYRHVDFFAAFLFGFAFACSPGAWDFFAKTRWASLAVAILSYGLYAYGSWATQDGRPLVVGAGLHVLYGIDQWSWVAAVFGFARQHLTGQDSRVRRYLTEAIFPFYIIHQTIIILAAHGLRRFDLSAGVEATILVVLTVAGCALFYELGRRVVWLRPWIGLKNPRKEAKAEIGFGTAATTGTGG